MDQTTRLRRLRQRVILSALAIAVFSFAFSNPHRLRLLTLGFVGVVAILLTFCIRSLVQLKRLEAKGPEA
jgi:hypothetical protein